LVVMPVPSIVRHCLLFVMAGLDPAIHG
jgi:hypothetical protein